MSAGVSHQIAARAATQLVKDGVAADLSWAEIATSCETAIAIVVMAAAEMASASDKMRFASEIIDTMTEHANRRVAALIMGVPYEG